MYGELELKESVFLSTRWLGMGSRYCKTIACNEGVIQCSRFMKTTSLTSDCVYVQHDVSMSIVVSTQMHAYVRASVILGSI